MVIHGSDARAFHVQLAGEADTEHEHATQPAAGTDTEPETS
jgi:hypothetical protein